MFSAVFVIIFSFLADHLTAVLILYFWLYGQKFFLLHNSANFTGGAPVHLLLTVWLYNTLVSIAQYFCTCFLHLIQRE